jgi:hypothetical protein
MNIVVDVVVGFVLLMLLFGWIGVCWLWVTEFRDMWRHRGWKKVHSKMAARR